MNLGTSRSNAASFSVSPPGTGECVCQAGWIRAGECSVVPLVVESGPELAVRTIEFRGARFRSDSIPEGIATDDGGP